MSPSTIKHSQDLVPSTSAGFEQEASEAFWRTILETTTSETFPPLPNPSYTPAVDTSIIRTFPIMHESVAASILIRTALGLVLAKYTHSDEATFGVQIKNKVAFVSKDGAQAASETTIIPIRFQMDPSEKISDALQRFHAEAEASASHAELGLVKIQNLSSSIREACQFQTIVVEYQNGFAGGDSGLLGVPVNATSLAYALSIHWELADGQANMVVQFDSAVLSRPEVKSLLDVCQHVLGQLMVKDNGIRLMGDIEYMPPSQKALVSKWNAPMPEAVDLCVHDLVQRQVELRPDSEAICSWDGNLTYRELDALSTKLAQYLARFHVGPDKFVPFCFSKSAWAIVSILAISKAGAAFVAIDPSHPPSRIEALVQTTKASVGLTSPAHFHLLDGPLENVIVVTATFLKNLDVHPYLYLAPVKPSNLAYMISTSGSTGVPKSILVEHRSLSTAILGLVAPLSITSKSRVLQFAAYTFDVSIGDIFTTLSQGGCLAIPSEYDRMNNLAGAIVRMNVNNACLTPTVVSLLCPEDVPCLTALSLGGEALQKSSLDTWAGRVSLTNIYGPSEGTTWCAANKGLSTDDSPHNLGTGLRARLWIADDNDHNRLCPIGCVGELLIEGPVLARCYLDKRQNELSFIENPSWAEVPSGQRRRFYKTGDLVKYDADGTVAFIARKDSQVKIRGHRVEIGEIEYHLAAHDLVSKSLVILPASGKYRQQLVGVICLKAYEAPLGSSAHLEALTSAEDEGAAVEVHQIQESLSTVLPPYMVPQSWIVVKNVPLLLSGKLARKQVQQIVENMNEIPLTNEAHHDSRDEQRTQMTDMEKRLRDLWATVLDIAVDSVGAETHFFRLGGNSLLAMRLVAAALKDNLSLTVASVFEAPVLAEMATRATEISAAGEHRPSRHVRPFELVGGLTVAEKLIKEASVQWNLAWDRVQDIYPCTPLQAGLMALSAKNPGTYTLQHVYKLWMDVDIDRFMEAWAAVVRNVPILRTVIIPSESQGPSQVVLDIDITWHKAKDLESYLAKDAELIMTYGAPLNRFAITEDHRHFIWTAHHSTYDGFSTGLVLKKVEQMYRTGKMAQPVPVVDFIRNIQAHDVEALKAFWRDQLHAAPHIPFPQLPSATYEARTNARIEDTVYMSRKTGSIITDSTVIRAAWVLVVARYSDSEDIVFGATQSGRTAPVVGIADMIGPTITTVPVRVKLDSQESVPRFLQRIQKESTMMISFEQAGLQQIGSLGPTYQAACNFQNLLVVHPSETFRGLDLLGLERIDTETSGRQEVHTFILKLDCVLSGAMVTIKATYDDQAITDLQVSRLFHQFSHVLQQLAPEPENKPVGAIEMLSPQDLVEIRRWNDYRPELVEKSIPDVFSGIVKDHPGAPAISSWDQSSSYSELDRISTFVARYLRTLGVRAEVIVPICFDKSAWAIVAMIGILKAGGAYVALDPGHPDARLTSIIEDVEAKVMIAAPQHAERFLPLVEKVVPLDPGLIDLLAQLPDAKLPEVSPTSPAIVVFTSGSTGKPKGIVLEHQTICSSLLANASKCQVGLGSRVFQFAAYVFDVSVGDIFISLMTGACICVPSPHDRMNNIAAAINKLEANVAFLTPTVASLLKPEDVPGLKRMVLAGEAATKENVRDWAGRLALNIFYGPAETTVYCAGTQPVSIHADPANLGHAHGARQWIVDRADHNKLVPIGCVGEILVEGPVVARGYLKNPEKTAASFIDNPAWASKSGHGRTRRFYRTGDLARYTQAADGSMSFVARKDNQVKVRGQRVELAEVEYHVYTMKQIRHIVATVPKRGPFKGRLVAMLAVNDGLLDRTASQPNQGSQDTCIEPRLTRTEVASLTAEIRDCLMEKVPSYMVPSAFVFVEKVPLNTSGKLHRQEVGAWFESMSNEVYKLVSTLSQRDEPSEPLTTEEQLIQGVCSQVLKIDSSQIPMSQSFLSHGGDSITAMLVVTRCRTEGMVTSVRDVLRTKSLRQLAGSIIPVEDAAREASREGTAQTASTPSNAAKVTKDQRLLQDAATKLGLSRPEDIEDVFPCTSVQNGMLIAHARDSRFYEVHYCLEVMSVKRGVPIDTLRLEKAWRDVVRRQPALRTVFFESSYSNGAFHQAVLRKHHADVVHIRSEDEDLLQTLLSQQSIDFDGPRPPNRLTICTTSAGRVFIGVEILHTMSDGTTWDLIFKELNQAYEGSLPNKSPPPYSNYVSYLVSQRTSLALDYWKQYLANTRPCLFPSLGDSDAPVSEMLNADVDFSRGLELLKFCKANGVTVSNVIQTAWALVLRSYVKCNEVCFGYVNSGRDAPLDGIEEAIGTYIGQLICRVDISANDSVMQIIKKVQEGYLNGLDHPHVPLSELYHGLGLAGQSLFNTNMHLMRVTDPNGYEFSSLAMKYKHTVDPSEYNFTVGTWVSNQDVIIYMSYWTSDLSTAQATRVANLLGYAVDSILDDPQRQVSTLGEGLGDELESTTSMIEEAVNVSLPAEDSKNLVWPALSSEQEALRKLWSGVLGIDVQRIWMHADFIQLGGDSLLTMKLITAARAAGLELTFIDALSHTNFSEMVNCLRRLEEPLRTIELSESTSGTSSEPESWSFAEDPDDSEVTRESSPPALNNPSSILFVLDSDSFPTLYLEDCHSKQPNADTYRVERLSATRDFEDLLPTSLVQQSMLTSQLQSHLELHVLC